MKRLVMIATLLMLLGLTSQGIAAQDASPAAGGPPPTALLDGLGYPTLAISYDGTNVTAPTELTAGRYRLNLTDSSGSPDAELSIFGATGDHSADEIIASLSTTDLSGPPPAIYFQVKNAGGGTAAQPAVVTLPAGDWVVAMLDFGAAKPLVSTQKVTVTGDMPTYDAISDAVDVTLVDMAIQMPETVPAGPHIWQITNTGSLPHFLDIMRAPGPITVDEAVNGVKVFEGDADATPVASGSDQDPNTWKDMGGSSTITNGMTNLIELDLEPGTYMAFCFLEGPGDLGLHALNGMTVVFTVE